MVGNRNAITVQKDTRVPGRAVHGSKWRHTPWYETRTMGHVKYLSNSQWLQTLWEIQQQLLSCCCVHAMCLLPFGFEYRRGFQKQCLKQDPLECVTILQALSHSYLGYQSAWPVKRPRATYCKAFLASVVQGKGDFG